MAKPAICDFFHVKTSSKFGTYHGYRVRIDPDRHHGGFRAKLIGDFGTLMEPHARTKRGALAQLVKELRREDAEGRKLAREIMASSRTCTTSRPPGVPLGRARRRRRR